MAIIAKYKFNSSLYSDYLPIFNDEFTGYTKTDINNGDGTITRTISHDTLKPTYMRFGVAMNSSTDREKSLIEVIECDTSEVTNMGNMFFGCHSLISLNVSNFNTSKATNMQYMFNDCKLLTSLDLSNFDTSKVTNFDSIFENCTSLATINVSSWDTSKVTNMAYMFNNCKSLTSLDLSSFNTSKATNMTKIFNDCSKLTSLVLSNFNTSKVENMTNMFTNCSSLTSLDISNFNTSKVTTMRSMFSGCSSLTSLNVSSFDTGNVTIMYAMFQNCSSLTTLDLSNFNTSKVTNMNSIFENCRALTSLNVSSFDTSKATDISYMFNGCSSLTSLDVSNFNTSNVTTIRYMFRNCSNLTTLDLSSFNTSKVTNMSWMFNECSKLTTLDLSNFDTSSVTDMSYMLGSNCLASDIGLLYATSATINSLVTALGTSVARNIYYTDASLSELTVQNNITYKEYKITQATFPYTLNKLPNGVADYIDVVNKIHVQRVGKVVLDGSESWVKQHNITDYTLFSYILPTFPTNTSVRLDCMICDKINVENYQNLQAQAREFITIRNGTTKQLLLNLSNSKASDVNTIQTYLASNPITVIYQLATPIYTPLTEEEIAQLPLSAYADGYVMLSSDQLMPSFEFRMRASNRYQVDMLETGYYYLNAPVGNVKLGTANVDVQQMPCIVKVDNVGTGDSGYRLGFGGKSYYMDLPLNYEKGYLDVNTGNVVTGDNVNGRWVSDFIEVPYYNKIIYIINKCGGIDFVYYDENKSFINGVAIGNTDTVGEYWLTGNTSAKYIRISGKSDKMTVQLREQPITLAKLPSHRIPTSFTQGMKCGTDFGYWEGIKESAWRGIRLTGETGDGSLRSRDDSIRYLNRLEGSYQTSSIVEDEFDFATGKLTKRIGKVELNSSNIVAIYEVSQGSNGYVYITIIGDKLGIKTRANLGYNKNYGLCITDKTRFEVNYGGASSHCFIAGNNIGLYIKTNEFGGIPTVQGFKDYFSAHPLTFYYELAVPEISYVDVLSHYGKTASNKTDLRTNYYIATTYLQPQYKPSHLTYPVPSLVGNRTYTVVHNRKNITSSTKPIELNLGGTVVQLNDTSSKTLVKTPSTLAHSNLIFIGGESTVDHIMVLDGDWTNKPIEYFENMKGHDTDAIITIIGDGKIDDVAEQYLW